MASSGPYQSHLFNFLNRHAQKVADKAGLALRNLKVAAVWGTQILIYPIYAVYQTARIAGRQLKQTARRRFLELRQSRVAPTGSAIDILATDAPIHFIIGAIEQIIAPVPVFQAPARAVWQIPQGSRFAWLWQLLPIQRKAPLSLQPPSSVLRLRAEIAELEAQLDPHSLQTSLLPYAVSSPVQQAPPLPIQGVASMLETHHMVVILVGNVIYDILTLEQQYRIGQQITIELASLAHRRRVHRLNEMPAAMPLPVPADRPTLLPPLRIFQQLMAWVQQSPIAIATNLFGESTFLEPTAADWFIPNLASAPPLPGPEPHRLPSTSDLKTLLGQLPRWTDIEALVWAAIHYFFGNRGKQLNSGQAWIAGHPASSERAGQFAPATPWLTMPDLFASPDQPPAFYAASSDLATLPHLPELQLGQSIQNFVQRFLKPKSQVVHQRRTVTPPSEIVQTTSDKVVAAPSAPALDAPAIASDWIEAEATAVGYIKSPWHHFLDGLDAGVRWLEEQFIRLWNWLTGR